MGTLCFYQVSIKPKEGLEKGLSVVQKRWCLGVSGAHKCEV